MAPEMPPTLKANFRRCAADGRMHESDPSSVVRRRLPELSYPASRVWTVEALNGSVVPS